MGAKVICDAVGLPQSPGYYSLYANIPTGRSGSIQVDGTVGHLGHNPFKFEYLILSILLRVSYGQDLCVVCHGSRDRLGIFTKGESWLHHKELDLLIRQDPHDFESFGMNQAAYQKLLDNLATVRKLNINHLAIRACRIGNDRQYLKKLAFVLGANSVSAPTLKTAYLKPRLYGVTNDTQRKMFTTAFPIAFDVPLSSNAKVTLGSYELSKTQFKAGIAADAEATLGQFYRDNFPGTATPTRKQLEDGTEGFPMHGLCVPGNSHKFYFPKDPRYVSHLTNVTNCRFAFI